MACEVLNALAQKLIEKGYTVTGTAIIPVDTAQLDHDDPKRVLEIGKPGLVLEVGNLAFEKNPLVDAQADVTHAIVEGLNAAQR